jgi:hypothetical protein
LGDFNRDGALDVVLADAWIGADPGAVAIALGNGDTTFQRWQVLDAGPSPSFSCAAAADLNDDGIPSSGTFFTQGPLAYAAFSVSPKVALEGQLGLTYLSYDDESIHVLSFATQLDYLFKGDHVSSPYAFLRARVDNSGGDDDSETHTGLGGGIGYRLRAGDRAVVRFDGRYDHLFGNDSGSDFLAVTKADVFSVAVSIGVRL